MAATAWDLIFQKYKPIYFHDVYIKLVNQVQVYQVVRNRTGKNTGEPFLKWEGWKVSKGAFAGELGSIFQLSESYPAMNKNFSGRWCFFKGTAATGGKDYFLFLTPKDIDWTAFAEELKRVKRENSNFIERFILDIQDSIAQGVDYTKTKAIQVGTVAGVGFALYLLWEFGIKPEIQVRRFERVARNVVKEYKKA